MDGDIDYYPTGKFLYSSGNDGLTSEFSMSDKWLVDVSAKRKHVCVKITVLEDGGGRIVPVNEAQVKFGAEIWNPWRSHVVYYDLILLVIFNGMTEESKIYVIHPDRNNEYEVYQGPNFVYHPMGIDGDIVYIAYEENSDDGGVLVIGGFNVRTCQTVFKHITGDAGLYSEVKVPNPSLFRTYDGTLAAAIEGSEFYNEPVVSRIVSIPDLETLLEVEGSVDRLIPSQDGVFYTSYQSGHYFATLNGGQYRINFLDDERNVDPGKTSIIAASDSGDSIWIEHAELNSLYEETYIVNYKRCDARNQKSARCFA